MTYLARKGSWIFIPGVPRECVLSQQTLFSDKPTGDFSFLSGLLYAGEISLTGLVEDNEIGLELGKFFFEGQEGHLSRWC